jgi:hypothetical protein
VSGLAAERIAIPSRIAGEPGPIDVVG